jgi:hypothetical protein
MTGFSSRRSLLQSGLVSCMAGLPCACEHQHATSFINCSVVVTVGCVTDTVSLPCGSA